LWSDTARLQPDFLFKFLNLIQIGAVLLPDILGNILCCNVRSCSLAPFVALTFCVKSGAHDGVFEFCMEVGAFALELLPGFSVLHFELRNLALVFNQAKSFLFCCHLLPCLCRLFCAFLCCKVFFSLLGFRVTFGLIAALSLHVFLTLFTSVKLAGEATLNLLKMTLS
jgi:hypothetical protein